MCCGLISIPDAAKQLNVSTAYIYTLIKEGLLHMHGQSVYAGEVNAYERQSRLRANAVPDELVRMAQEDGDYD